MSRHPPSAERPAASARDRVELAAERVDLDELLAVLDGLAGLGQEARDDAVDRGHDLLATPEHVDAAQHVTGAARSARRARPRAGLK